MMFWKAIRRKSLIPLFVITLLCLSFSVHTPVLAGAGNGGGNGCANCSAIHPGVASEALKKAADCWIMSNGQAQSLYNKGKIQITPTPGPKEYEVENLITGDCVIINVIHPLG